MADIIVFPFLGGMQFSFSPIAFTVGGRVVYWYGIIVTVAILAAAAVALYRAKLAEMDGDKIVDAIFVTVVAGLLGTRFYYVAFAEGLGWADLFRFRDGGLAIYGGLIGGTIGLLAACRIKKIPFWDLVNVAAPAVLVGQAIGRWGNFANREAYGVAYDGFFRMELHGVTTDAFISVHPTFLYESLWCLLGAFLIMKFAKKDEFWWFAGWYGLGRAWIEGLRADALMMGGIRVSQMVAIVSVVVAAVVLVRKKMGVKSEN